jgi:hypothetical protein
MCLDVIAIVDTDCRGVAIVVEVVHLERVRLESVCCVRHRTGLKLLITYLNGRHGFLGG